MAAIGNASSMQLKVEQLVSEIGLRILRSSEFVLDCSSEDGLNFYKFIFKPFSPAHLDIQLDNLLEDGDQPHWAHVEAACMQANRHCDTALIIPEGGHQLSVITEFHLKQLELPDVGDVQDRMAVLHDTAAIFFRKLADIESEASDGAVPSVMVRAHEHLQ